ncbi:MAG: ribonuclease H-like domain-containing protein [Chloroflexi bacterium]|nr:ribonuclease H-like domain-containing protein [Chloroflexota bacterium]
MTESAIAIRARRLERLRDTGGGSSGGAAGDGPSAGPTSGLVERLTVGDADPVPVLPSGGGRDGAIRLARTLGGHLSELEGGTVVVVERRVPLPVDLAPLRELPEPVDPSRPIIFLDTETTGLGTAAGTVPFLVALARWQGDDLVVRQLLLPDHPDEPAMLTLLERHLPPDSVLVTYNGRTFDWPLIVSRYRLHGRPPPRLGAHLDLLSVARALWRHRLPDARLATVEAAIAGVRRYGDLPGALIPERYFRWLRDGTPEVFPDILVHNDQDVVSLALLLRVLAHEVLPGRRPGVGRVATRDLLHLGRMYARRGATAEALDCYDAALERLSLPWQERELQATLGMERARALARLGQRAEARSAWEAVALEGGHHAPRAWIQVAKSLEHADRDPQAAQRAARRAATIAARLRFLGEPQPTVERDLSRRLARLARRLGEAGRDRAA